MLTPILPMSFCSFSTANLVLVCNLNSRKAARSCFCQMPSCLLFEASLLEYHSSWGRTYQRCFSLLLNWIAYSRMLLTFSNGRICLPHLLQSRIHFQNCFFWYFVWSSSHHHPFPRRHTLLRHWLHQADLSCIFQYHQILLLILLRLRWNFWSSIQILSAYCQHDLRHQTIIELHLWRSIRLRLLIMPNEEATFDHLRNSNWRCFRFLVMLLSNRSRFLRYRSQFWPD